ncbi:MAG: tetratricopeptide repeat protein [Anaerolineales bacterium]|nr:tetratricopeptide repeat protein [Anaerolineales bacterium]
MQVHSDITLPSAGTILTAAGITLKISEVIQDRLQAAVIQSHLRAYQPVWEMAHHPVVLSALLDKAESSGDSWWRPARVALAAIVAVHGLDGTDQAEDWLSGFELDDVARYVEISVPEPNIETETVELLVYPLIQDAWQALALYHESKPAEWLNLSPGVLTVLYDFLSRTSSDSSNTAWLAGIARVRPDVAARVLIANLAGDGAGAARRIAMTLLPSQALAFSRALEDLNAMECVRQVSAGLVEKLPATYSDSLGCGPDCLAHETMGRLYLGQAAFNTNVDLAINELEQAWLGGQEFMAALAKNLGLAHLQRSDPMEALAAFQLGMKILPAHTGLRAAAARSLNDLTQHQEALDLLGALPENKVKEEFDLVYERSRALTAMAVAGRLDCRQAADSVDRLVELADSPERMVRVARLYTGLGDNESAIDCLENALAQKPGRIDWCHELGRLNVGNDNARAENYYTQALALDPENLEIILELVDIYRAQGKMELALELAAYAANLQPQNPKALHAWVDAAFQAGQWQTAISAGKAALALRPESAAVHVYIGQAYAALDQEEEALYYLSRAARLPSTPADPTPWLAWVDYLVSLDKTETIEEVLEEGIRQLGDKGTVDLYCRMADYYEKSGRPTEAQSTLMRAYQSGERSGKLLTQLGSVLNQLGHHTQAVKRLEEAVAQKDANEKSYHALALALESSGRQSEALVAARKAVELGTNSPEIMSDAGRLSLGAGNFIEAAGLLEVATAGRPENISDWKLLGQAQQGAGKWEKALDAYSSAVKLAPNDPYLQHQIGLVCTELGRYDTAIVALTEASRRLPQEEQVQNSLANALEAAGWWNKAAQIRSYIVQLAPKVLGNLINWARASRRADDLDDALDAIKRAEEIAPGHPKVVLESGLYELAQGDRIGAIQSLTNLARNCDDTSILIKTGEALVSLKKLDTAAVAFSRAAELEPDNPTAQSRLGDVSARLDENQAALEAYQAAARLEPEKVEHHIAVGQMHWRLQDAPAASKAWEYALQVDPTKYAVHEKLAQAYEQMGSLTAALDNYEQAAQKATSSGKPVGGAWRQAGRIALELDQLDNAQRYLKRALVNNTRDHQAHSLAGVLADRLGKRDEALISYRKAARLEPGERAYQLQLADALAERGKELDALEIWQTILDQTGSGKENVALLEKMAKLYSQAGRFDDAKRTLNMAIEKSAGSKSYKRQLAGVLVEEAELADFWRRAGIQVAGAQGSLKQAVGWLSPPETPQEKRDLARAQVLLGDFEKAIDVLGAYRSKLNGPGSGDLKAQRALGVAYRKIGKYDAAIQALSSAVQLVSNDVQSLAELAQTYLESDQAQTALSLLGWLTSQNQVDPILLYYCAVAAHETSDQDQAVETLQKAVEQRPEVASWQRRLSVWLRQAGRASDALEFAEKAIELSRDENSSEQAKAHVELARGLRIEGRFQEAIEQWRTALELAPENGLWWKELGKLLLDAGQAETAIDCFSKAQKTQSCEGEAEAELLLWWSKACLALDELNQAKKHLDRAVDLSPENPAVLAGLGHWQAASGKWQDALTSYQTALIKSRKKSGVPAGDRANYHFLVARAFHALASPVQAIEELERAANIDPKNGDVYALLGEIYDELDNQDLARQAYQQAAQVAPTDPSFVLKLAQFLQNEGQLDQALDWLTKAITAIPSSGLWLEAARLYEKRGQRAKQMEALHHAVDLEPENARALYELGLAFKQRKAYNQAIKAFETVTELEPRNQEAHKQLSAVIAMSLAGRIGRGKTKG